MSENNYLSICGSGGNFNTSQNLVSRRIIWLIQVLILILIGFVSGCASTSNKSNITMLIPDDSGLEIILMPLDVELSILTAGGMLEPQAEWTTAAKMHMVNAILEESNKRNGRLIIYDQPVGIDPLEQKLIALERLHSAVGQSILVHEYVSKLPSKEGKFDWSLGPEVSILKERHNADYALFIFIRDSYSSAGRVLMQLGAAVLGVGLQGGTQLGFASLVDLRSGDIVWFNRLISGTGDLRTEVPAIKTVAKLLEGMPE